MQKLLKQTTLTFSFMYCKIEKASISLLSSPNALINELRAKRLGLNPSDIITLYAFTACSDKPCQMIKWKNTKCIFKKRFEIYIRMHKLMTITMIREANLVIGQLQMSPFIQKYYSERQAPNRMVHLFLLPINTANNKTEKNIGNLLKYHKVKNMQLTCQVNRESGYNATFAKCKDYCYLITHSICLSIREAQIETKRSILQYSSTFVHHQFSQLRIEYLM